MEQGGIIQVTIFGNSYTLVCEDNPEYLRELAAFINDRMSEISRLSGEKAVGNVAILAALNIADDLFRIRKELRERELLIERKGADLIRMIETKLSADQG